MGRARTVTRIAEKRYGINRANGGRPRPAAASEPLPPRRAGRPTLAVAVGMGDSASSTRTADAGHDAGPAGRAAAAAGGRRALGPELTQVVVQVLVHERAPLLPAQRPEQGVLRPGALLRPGGQTLEQCQQLGPARVEGLG